MRRIVTEWFRVPRVWPHVEKHLAGLDRPLVVWSGGCGTGEEPYSAAIMLEELGIPGRVVATDLDEQLLAIARQGEYSRRNITLNLDERRLTTQQVGQYFDYADGRYTVRAEIRQRVDFAVGALGTDQPPQCDVAFVRNVWRHLGAAVQRRLAAQVHECLPADGLLLLGGGDLMTQDPITLELKEIEPAGLSQYFAESREHELIWRPREG
ncbi:hypothetical protein L0U85_01810 [Glycomyces sp. L485]|uniref:CheR family methyltransferase n=1 Tax=Glycomyces sp. L485 TaxID=2909235 RepID=UPI001F4B57B1|nr:hypothetical protein [Glycomyces sp. L485]